MLSEAQVEKRLKDRVSRIGGKVLKFVSPGCRGVPDRLVFMPGGKIYLVELKKPGEDLRPQQKKRQKEFLELGFKFYVIDDYKKVEAFIDEIHTT